MLGDKAFDADWLRKQLHDRGASAVIPPRRHRKHRIDYDAHMYRWRHPIENHFARIKEFRGIATRYGKTDTGYRANLNPVAAIIAAKKCQRTLVHLIPLSCQTVNTADKNDRSAQIPSPEGVA